MSSVTSEYCRDDISGYACSNMSYEHDKHEFCEGYDGPYEHGNGALAYDDDSYEGYDCPWDNEQHGGENYYSGDDFEMNGTYDSCDDVEGVERPYGVYHCKDEGFHVTNYGYDGDVRYNSFSHRSYEFFEQNLDRNGSCEVEFPSSSCATSYPKKEGIDVWAGPFQSHRVAHRSNTFTTSQNMMTFSSHPSSNISCSPFGDEVGGKVGGTLSHEVVELRESFTALREDFDDFLQMFEKVKSMVQKRQVIHHEDKPKELPLEAKQEAPYKGDVKELNMEVKTPTPYAPKWKLNLKLAEDMNRHWLIGGDFNVLLNEEEKVGGLHVLDANPENLHCFIVSCYLTKVILDKILINQEIHAYFNHIEVEDLLRTGSGHAPMLLPCEAKVSR
ncbi:hypothetical protein H5410_036973 [Solanum commersonii]|uniref:Uncharacterized protein n=1 Tax=Solanum commersonii TaxID=4109 RepID=A0A9J5Y6F9_SOLCO|nr:hypothetical protein H5410_036973 [Solanum commersonii]